MVKISSNLQSIQVGDSTFSAANMAIINPVKKSFDYKEFASGCGAAFVNITITYPIYKVIFRQMLHGVGFTSAYQQLTNEGGYFLYRGILPPLLQKAVSLSLMFGIYEEIHTPLERANVPPILALSTAAIIAGGAEALLIPFERVQTLLQDRNYHGQFRNMPHCLQVLAAENGVKEYFRGMVPVLIRNTSSNVMFFYLREQAKNRLPRPVTWYGELSKEFLSGAVIGAFVSTLIYPLNVVKVHMQSSIGGPFQSWFTVLVQIYRERGLKGLSRGLALNSSRSALSWAIINSSYSFFMDLLSVPDKNKFVIDRNRDE